MITYGGEQNLLFSTPRHMFNHKEATVACRTLGLRSGGIPDVRALEESSSIVNSTIMDFKCDGTEPNLFSCDHGEWEEEPFYRTINYVVYIKCLEEEAPERCCIEGSVNVNLENGVQRKGTLPGITNLTPFAMPTTTTHPGNQCMTRAAFKINFQHIMPLFGCVKRPMCGRRFLRIKLYLHPTERPNPFTIADIDWRAADHDDYNNDGGLSSWDGNLDVFPNNWCVRRDAHELFDDAIKNATNCVTIWIGNNYFRLKTDTGFLIERCYRCMFSLNWQFNYSPLFMNKGGPEQDIFVYLNGKDERGGGVCKASFNWICTDKAKYAKELYES